MNGKVTLLITTFNRSQLLEKTLRRLTHLTLPDEILVIDDGSHKQTDATEWVCKGFSGSLPIKYIYNNNPAWSICSMARNIGVKQALGDIIITSEPELFWVTDIIPEMLAQREKNPNHVISVGTIYHMQERASLRELAYTDPKKFLEESIVEEYQTEPRPYNQEGFCKTVNMTATFCALYEREWLMKIGGWDEEFEGGWGFDDHDLLTRLRVSGYNQVIDAEMEAIHQFHPHLPPHIMGEGMKKNEDRFLGKNLVEGSPNIIANQGKEWGIIKE